MSSKVDVLQVFAFNLLRIRTQKGYSQRNLAAESGVDYADISRMENAKKDTTLLTIRVLAEALEVSDFELLITPKKLL
jgi:transcriptional regulator with XRE-family HTH domain